MLPRILGLADVIAKEQSNKAAVNMSTAKTVSPQAHTNLDAIM